MSAILVKSLGQLAARVCRKARHCEHHSFESRRKDRRIAADQRAREFESAIKSVIYGPLFAGVEL